ncbi:MAG: hypothetical protein IPM15_13750 [Betaproteobacteria bacterium]|nr:hypothetical protein [Betaproteobacteria bacterium]MCC6247704.1 hypothetical protein [Rubrivivax sp.]MCL4696453.1 hypothetical protein [Burkholderiaceae bacterium]
MNTPHDAAPGASAQASAAMAAPRPGQLTYLVCLAWAFNLFNGVRLLTYLPTIWAIHRSAASDQHSLLTWFAWFGANLTMGLWLYAQADQRLERAALVNFGNAAMCFVTGVFIVIYR